MQKLSIWTVSWNPPLDGTPIFLSMSCEYNPVLISRLYNVPYFTLLLIKLVLRGFFIQQLLNNYYKIIKQTYFIVISKFVVLESPSTFLVLIYVYTVGIKRETWGMNRHVMGSRVNEVNMGHPPRRPLPHDVTGRWRIGAELDPQSAASVQFQLSTSYLNTVLELRIGSEIEMTE